MNVRHIAIVLIVLLTTSTVGAADVATSRAGGGGAADAQSMVTLTVTVTDKYGEGISGADLTAEWDGGSNTAQTASNGKAFLDVAEGADVEISVDHHAYTRNNPVTVEDADAREMSIVVSRKGEAAVRVLDDGTPIADAQVRMTKQGQERVATEGRTDDGGVFASGTIERGHYEVVAVKAGYYRNQTTVEVWEDTQTDIVLEEGTVTVDVTVRDDSFDEPRALEGAEVRIEGPTTATLSTSGSGTGTIGLPVNAKYTVRVSKDGYETKTRSVNVGEESRALEFSINREDALTVEAVNQRVVVGENVQIEVADEYGDRVEGATVRVDGEAVGETNAEGTYRATIDSAGEHAITVEKDGVTSGEVTVEGVTTGGDGGTPTDTATPTDGPDDSDDVDGPPGLPNFSQPSTAMKIGAAAVGILLSFLVVRRLL